MGISIHHQLRMGSCLMPADARDVVEKMRACAVQVLGSRGPGAVSEIVRGGPARYFGRAFPRCRSICGTDRFYQPEVRPLYGSGFTVEIGPDCEPLALGLFKYPQWVCSDETGGWTALTEMGKDWQFRGHCKTQYASLHGWENFRRCHCGVIEILAALSSLYVNVEISDDGDYWPSRSRGALAGLRREVEGMNRVIAAAAGAMKDAFEDDGGVEAPIFAHPQFERLEVEGVALRGSRPMPLKGIIEGSGLDVEE